MPNRARSGLTCERCFYPEDLDRDDVRDKKGVRFNCPRCRTEYIYGALCRKWRTIHTVMRMGPIHASTRKRRGGVWKIERSSSGRHLYMTCPSCATIHKIELEDVYRDGYIGGKKVASCIDCGDCGLHFWPYLEGWKKRRR